VRTTKRRTVVLVTLALATAALVIFIFVAFDDIKEHYYVAILHTSLKYKGAQMLAEMKSKMGIKAIAERIRVDSSEGVLYTRVQTSGDNGSRITSYEFTPLSYWLYKYGADFRKSVIQLIREEAVVDERGLRGLRIMQAVLNAWELEERNGKEAGKLVPPEKVSRFEQRLEDAYRKR
jgi:hypothetical protein